MTEAQRDFLDRLVSGGGHASLRELGPQTSQEQNSARQTCKRRGWARYSNGAWFITEAGRAALLMDKADG